MEKHVKKSEYACFTTATFGRSMMYNLYSMFALVFFTECVLKGVPNAGKIAGTIILVARIFDALNDPVMGIIVDKTQTKYGKFRPYLLWSPFLIAVATTLLFWNAGINSAAGKVAYCAVTYILWGVCFTIQDIPFWGLSSAISPDENERTKFISVARLGSTFGGIIPTLLVPMLTDSMDQSKAYLLAGLLIGFIGSGLSLLAFFGTKEKLILHTEPKSVKEIFGGFIKNKYLMLLIGSCLLASTVMMAQTASPYVAKYLFDYQKVVSESGVVSYKLLYADGTQSFLTKGLILTVLSVMIGVGMVPAMLLLPILKKKFDFKIIYIFSMLFGAAVNVILYFVGFDKLGKASIFVLFFFLILVGIPLGIYNVITYNMVADATDYMEWKSGQRIEGISFAAQTLISKASAGVASLITGFVVDASNIEKFTTDGFWVTPETVSEGLSVPTAENVADVRGWIFIMITLIPAAGMLLTCIPMAFYDYSGKKKQKIKTELEVIREERLKSLQQ